MAQEPITTEMIIEKFRAKRGDEYDYHKVDYKGRDKNVEIICRKHGSFFQSPGNHLAGKGCLQCGIDKRAKLRALGQNKFIERFNQKHKFKYNYDKVGDIKNGFNKVTITCPKHGEFEQTAYNHMYGSGCPECGKYSGNIARTQESFIADSNIKHNNKYSYLKTEYASVHIPVIITCPSHGDFKQTPKQHLKGDGCPECGTEKTRITPDEYYNRANVRHNYKFSYPNKDYKGMSYPITYICPAHGEMTQVANAHLLYGCRVCASDARLKTQDEFIAQVKKCYGNLYGLEQTIYTNDKAYVSFTCKEHGLVQRIANDFIRGGGCPVCSASNAEKAIYMWLKEKGFIYKREYKIEGYKYRYDFYIPDLKVFIEFHGYQHFSVIKPWGGEEFLERVKRSDKAKEALIKSINNDLITITYLEESNLIEVLTKQLSKFIKYKRDGLYFRDFEHFSKYYNLPSDATLEEFKQYEYTLI